MTHVTGLQMIESADLIGVTPTVVLLTRQGSAGLMWTPGPPSGRTYRCLRRAGLDEAAIAHLEVHLTRAKANGAAGETVVVPFVLEASPLERVVLLGVGDRSPAALLRAGAGLARRVPDGDIVVCGLSRVAAAGLRAFTEGFGLGGYRFGAGVSRRTLSIVGAAARERSVGHGAVTAEAVGLARDLTNTPSSLKSPRWMVAQARRVARRSGLGISVRGVGDLRRQGFGGLIAVGQGSSRPPALVELSHDPRDESGRRRRDIPHVVLVGKGITFDTGGISLKPSAAMVAMKTDMAGSAAVLAVMSALRALDVRVRVTGLLALAENMPSGSATRPGDVITQYGGTTVEVLNTDAEGRLVLADGLAYAALSLRPDVLVDIATLTGAVGIALGRRDAGLFANDERLATRLERAADASGERVWRLPMVEDYRGSLASPVADVANIARPSGRLGPGAGAVVAALFLERFVADVAWAHLDIAGTGRADADDFEVSRGGTGWGVRLLLRWLESGRVR